MVGIIIGGMMPMGGGMGIAQGGGKEPGNCGGGKGMVVAWSELVSERGVVSLEPGSVS